ncbi:hypothetical protein LX32DRAFT_660761 [Colletotrichum zoysiae]|uniref:TauD/TfdA-like domain-containing protein n=1 Tax=Colletotrichum zoysiae TaxID=1216348 RepID=A0AAD9M3P0_9PEZI|nr:hypothetical protein LX32DRAFT_660761 [Colletotrichum zoysiae]
MAAVQVSPAPKETLPKSRVSESSPLFEPLNVPGQQDTAALGLGLSSPFPLSFKVTAASSLSGSIEAIRRSFKQSGDLARLMKQHGGAVLVRGLPIQTPDYYSRVAHAFGFRPHIEVGRPPLRTVLAPNLPIWPRSEYGWRTINPAWLTFCALELPDSGGGTPITSAIYIARELSRQRPKFFSELLTKGVKYVYRYTVIPLVFVSNTGPGVRGGGGGGGGAYGRDVTDEDTDEMARNKIENGVRRHRHRFVWHEDGSISVTHMVPVGAMVRRGLPSAVTTGRTTPPPTYGDGTSIDVEDLDLLLKLAEDGAVDVERGKGGTSCSSTGGTRQIPAAR